LFPISCDHPKVRSRLNKLMNSDIVLPCNRQYMKELELRLFEVHQQMESKRIEEREVVLHWLT